MTATCAADACLLLPDISENAEAAATADRMKDMWTAAFQHGQDPSDGHTDTQAATHKNEGKSSSPSKPSLESRTKQAQAAVLDELCNPKPPSLKGQLHHMHAASAVHWG